MKKHPLIGALFTLLTLGCTGIPKNISPVEHFEGQRYLGQWFEIARLDHSFERGLTRVSATYSLRPDGGLKVINRGYSAKEKAWKVAEGKAYFVREPSQGYLKVSFFGPFYGSYVIFELDREHYQYALITGPSRSYFWILARTPTLGAVKLGELVAKAKALGFDTDRLIFVDQGSSLP